MAIHTRGGWFVSVALFTCAVLFGATAGTAVAGNALYTTNVTGTVVNQNIYAAKADVYISGGPQNQNSSGLADGIYFFQVTDPSGKTLLSTDPLSCRQVIVSGGHIAGATGPCPHANGIFNPANGTTPVQLLPFADTPNNGGEYKVWLSADSTFKNGGDKTDNFKVRAGPPIPQGSCQPSSSLSVVVNGSNVVGYVPKGSWIVGPTGIAAVNIEGSSIVPTLIATPNIVNSCASNSVTGQTVCVANTSDVYLLSGTTLTNTLTSAGTGDLVFSGGFCTNCSVAMDGVHNKVALGLSLAGTPGWQFLNLATSTFEAPFPSGAGMISENHLIDPLHQPGGGAGATLLSAAENNFFEIIDVTTTTTPGLYENPIPIPGEVFGMDATAEDCSTGIALATVEEEEANPGASRVFLADLTQATFTPGSPGSWSTTGSNLQTLSESDLRFGAAGLAVAQGTHTGIVTGEFGGSNVTAIALPTTSGSGTPAISDWVTCSLGDFFSGLDPHPVTAYQSPNGGHAIGVLASAGAGTVAIVDLTMMLDTTIVPRTVGGHACSAGTLPASVVTLIPVP